MALKYSYNRENYIDMASYSATRRMKPQPKRAPAPLEYLEQIAVADALRLVATPGWLWTHIPSGEERDKRVAAKLQRMGVQPGWPDFLLLDPGGFVHLLELKRQRGGRLNEAQIAFAEALPSLCAYAVAKGAKEALAILKGWGAITKIRITL